MNRFTIASFIVIAAMLIIPQHFSCKKVDLKREVLVSTGPAQNVDFHSAFLNGDIVDPGEDDSFYEYGFVYSSSGNPSLNDEIAIVGQDWISGAFSYTLEGLNGNTTYFFRSYARTDDGDIYGNVNSFKTAIAPNATPPVVGTLPMLNVQETTATARGNVSETGGAPVIRRGFCIGLNPLPNIQDDVFSENGSGLGEFQQVFSGLEPETEYFVRAYAENQVGIAYGGQIVFTTGQGGQPVNEWLHYDDGENFDGIGLTDDGGFDVVIRFTPDQLAPYGGMAITKIKFFGLEGDPIEYYVEIFEGEQPTLDDLAYDQFVESPSINDWTEVTLDDPYFITGLDEIWVGYYISGALAGLFPAGIDDGPGVPGYGDIIGTGEPIQWGLLSNGGFDVNWNIQVFVTNQVGEEIQMTREKPVTPARKVTPGNPAGFKSFKQSAK